MASVQKAKPHKRRARLFPAIVIAAAFAFNCLTGIASLTPKRYEVSEDMVAVQSIAAPRRIENLSATEARRQGARNGVANVYTVDLALSQSLVSNAKSFFTALASFRSTASGVRASGAPFETASDGTRIPVDDTRSWKNVLTETELLTMTAALPVPITDATLGYALLEAADADLKQLEELVVARLSEKLQTGVSENELETVRAAVSRELQVTTLPARLKTLGELLFDAYLKPTVVIDSIATTREKEKAAAAVEPVYISRGATIVEQGQIVTAEQMQLLISLDLVKGGNTNRTFGAGVVLYLLCVYTLLFLYLRMCEPEVFNSNKDMVLLLLVLCLTIALQWLCYLIDPRIMPSVFAALLLSILISRPVAQIANLTLALSFSLLASGGGSAVLTGDSMLALSSMLAGGQATILAAEKSQQRGSLIGAGALGGGVGALVVAAGCMIRGDGWNTAVTFAGFTFAAALVLSVFCVGMLSVWENVFDIVTNARLHELANTNHPLLKKMMTAAPGTYHHSMMTASLAEGAAEAVGANALLARTGAMYHDVGKLRRPQYFKENQTDGHNVHDTLPPEDSAGYIIAHVKDAEALLSKYRMPSAIRKIAAEHHGTTLAAYFYYKALKQQEADGEHGEPVIERLFRYPGTPPATRESAIVMMADSCEAAVRSLSDPSKEDVANMVHKVIQGKVDDGQLSLCPLTLAEISRIEKSFCVTFSGLLHERIRYPGTELK